MKILFSRENMPEGKTKYFSTFFNVISCTCPRCHQGRMFVNRNPYKLDGWDHMNQTCHHCGLKYELEPGFYQGAMYVSYALGVALSVAVFLIYCLIFPFSPTGYFVTNSIVVLLFAPFLFRWARSLYLTFFVRYKSSP